MVGLIPDALIRVEFRSVGREAFQAQPRETTTEFADGFAFMGFAIVPYHDHRAAQMTQYVAQEFTHFGLLDVLAMQAEVQADTSAMRADRQGGDGGNLVVFVAVAGQRRPTARAPGAPNGRNQEEAGFVDESEVGAQPRGFFFIRGQSRRFHCSMAASFRWVARRSGFWQLQPSACRSRPTWSRW
jgi:hypothetical protein